MNGKSYYQKQGRGAEVSIGNSILYLCKGSADLLKALPLPGSEPLQAIFKLNLTNARWMEILAVALLYICTWQ